MAEFAKSVILEKKKTKKKSYVKILMFHFVWANLDHIQLYKLIKSD